MKKFLYKLWSRFLTQFGNIRLSKYPPFAYYDTVDYSVKGNNILEIMEILEPGDIVTRGYSSYLDSRFIPDPYLMSHGAIYVGDNTLIHAVAEGVSEINVIDFCQCDRIAIFKPRKYRRNAISNARKFLGMQYDFMFSGNNNSLYCFELCALCYPKLDVKTVEASKFFGLVKKNVYLAQSFFQSDDFELSYHFNPALDIDFRKDTTDR